MSEPFVLLTTSREESSTPYVAALRAVGFAAEQIRVVSPAELEGAAELGSRASGLLLSGGCDVEPERYGEAIVPGAGVESLPERDELEWRLLAVARGRRLPVWGICRGLQVANAFLGGTLWQDLPTERASDVVHAHETLVDALTHRVVADPESPFGRRLDGRFVNSRHHQAIRRLAPGLRAVARTSDGVVEAIELANSDPDGWWLRAVQWHPENLIPLSEQRLLWEDFAAAVRRRAETWT